MTVKLSANGIDLSVDAMASWVRSLVPRDIAMEVNVSGYDLAKAMETIVANVDLGATPPLKPEVKASFRGDVLPSGTVLVRAVGVRLASDLYEVSMDGQIKAGPGVKPTGSMVMRAKGLEAVQGILAEAAKTDHAAQSLMIALATAEGFATVAADGGSTWEIVLGEDGQVTVNGISSARRQRSLSDSGRIASGGLIEVLSREGKADLPLVQPACLPVFVAATRTVRCRKSSSAMPMRAPADQAFRDPQVRRPSGSPT